jgi:histidinol-phosphatase (PHP family)
MNSWVNYHSHTNYCDGSSAPEDYVREAVRKGLPAYGYSSHAPVDFETDWCMPQIRLDDYFSEIDKIKKTYEDVIQIYIGLEIDYFADNEVQKAKIFREKNLDYFIGSVHFLGSFDNGEPWNIDTSFKLFLKGLDKIYGLDIKKATIRFFETTRKMIEEFRPTIIGHIDKIKMYNSRGNFFNENEKWYKDQILLTINSLKKNDSIVEINTRGYYKYRQTDLYPSTWIIELMKKKGIPLMINSDSHHPSEIVKGMNYAASRLRELSIEKIYALYNNKWSEFYLDERGIRFN